MRIGKRNKFPKQNNGGYSLVELVAVLGIMAVVLGVATLSLWIIKNGRDKKIISSIKSGIGNTRIETLAKEDAVVKIYTKDNKYYVEQTIIDNMLDPSTPSGHKETVQVKEIGSSRDEVSINDGANSLTDFTDASPIVIKFERSTGAVDTANSSNLFTKIQAGNHYAILQPKTGKCLMDKDVGTVPTP